VYIIIIIIIIIIILNSVLLTDWLMDWVTNYLTNYSTPQIGGLPEKLTGPQLVKFPALYGTRRFIATLITVHHLSLSW